MSKKIYLLCFFLFFSIINAEEKKSVCLNMIVKNETKVIRRCLESARPIIDYWVIVDTGSDDGTQEMIREYMKDIPGELHERPWINFGHNRNEALQLAKGKGDYLLFIDADEIFVYEPNFKLPDLDKDFYHVMTDFNGMTYARVQLINNHLDWRWIGVLHETLDSKDARTNQVLYGINDRVYTDGARSQDPDKYKKDAKILEEGLRNEPDNSRYVFYLAQSYKDAGDYENSLKYYQKRIAMGGWDEELFWSKLQLGILEEALKRPPEKVLERFTDAYYYRPNRMEPLYHMALFCRTHENYALGYLMASLAVKIPLPQDILFVQKWMYDYGALLELSICAYWIGRYAECAQICNQLLKRPDLPQNIRECVTRNLSFAERFVSGHELNLHSISLSQ